MDREYDAIGDNVQRAASAKTVDEFYNVASGLIQKFGAAAKQGALSVKGKGVRENAIANWLGDQLDDFWTATTSRVSSSNGQLARTSFNLAMKIILIRGKYQHKSIKEPLATLLEKSESSDAIEEWIPYVQKFDDIRMWVLAAAAERPTLRIVPVLCEVEKVVENDNDLTDFYARPVAKSLKYRAIYQKAWLSLLKQPGLTRNLVKGVLSVLHARIIPNMPKPQLLMDFLVDAYDYGTSISLLALNAVFVLIQYHGLDYPNFFTKLYALLEDGTILVSSHRARFLRLLDLFLTSTHLPATITASIIKRLARLSLFAPPGAIVAVLPFIYNQLKRHPTCMIMIHRTAETEAADMFNPLEPDPTATHALESSLWELNSLTTHYQPNVASLARIFGQAMRKPSYQLEHFLSHSYETFYATERNRKRQVEPALEYEEPNAFYELEWIF